MGGVCSVGYLYRHPFRTEWHKPTLSLKISRHFSEQMDAWESMYEPIEEIAISKVFSFWAGFALRNCDMPKIQKWAYDIRSSLWDTAEKIAPVVTIERDEKHRINAGKLRVKIGHSRGPLMTSAIMIGLGADYDTKPVSTPTKGAPVTNHRALIQDLLRAVRTKDAKLKDVETTVQTLLELTGSLGEDQKFELQKIGMMERFIRVWIDIKKAQHAERVDELEESIEKRRHGAKTNK
jgi:hypothetical protein